MPLLTRFSRTQRTGAPGLPPSLTPDPGPRLRIALVTEYYYPHLGGVCEHVHFLAREARRRGHHVDIITSRMSGTVPQPGVLRIGRSVSVYANASHARFTAGIGLRRTMRRLLNDGAYDVVHVHSPLTPVLPLLAIEEAPCPVVGTFHTYFKQSHAYKLGRKYFQSRLEMLDAAIAVSHSTTVALERYFNADWKIVPNGIDVDMFRPGLPAPAGVRTDVPVILFLGRFDPRNGLPLLIDAFKKVRTKRRPAQLVVVGDGPLRSHYRQLAGDDPDIFFAGAVLDGRPAYYANSSVYACPTDRASFGITLLEAMACRTPVVCSDIAGFRDVVRHDREALMFPAGDVGCLADTLVEVIDDDVLRERLGTVGREHAMQYSWPSVTSRVLDVYRSVIGIEQVTQPFVTQVTA